MSSPHILDPLLEVWARVEEGQRQAIARDFHSRTGGLMATIAFPAPEVLALVSVLDPAGRDMGILLHRSTTGLRLPSSTLRLGELLPQAARRAVGKTPGFEPHFEPLGQPLVMERQLLLLQASATAWVQPEDPRPGWEVGLLPPSAPLHHRLAQDAWFQLAPLRLARAKP